MSLDVAKCYECKEEGFAEDEIANASDRCSLCQYGICEDHTVMIDELVYCTPCSQQVEEEDVEEGEAEDAG